MKAIALILVVCTSRREEDGARAQVEKTFLPASNPGWANRDHTDWLAPICHYRNVSDSSAYM